MGSVFVQDASRRPSGICQEARSFCHMICVTTIGQDSLPQHHLFSPSQKLKRERLPFHQSHRGIFRLCVLLLLPAVQAVCFSPPRFEADQAHRQKRYVALAGTQIRLTCSHDSSAVQQCAACSSGVKHIQVQTRDRQLSFTKGLVPSTFVERNDSHTVVTIRNASVALTGYYWCTHCPIHTNNGCLTDGEGQSTTTGCLFDTLNLVIVEELPSLTTKLCCAMNDDSLNCSFGQNQAGKLYDTATTWEISYLTSDVNGTGTASCRSESCYLQLPRHTSLRLVNYSFVVTSMSLLGRNSWTSAVYTDHSVERLPSVHGLQIEAVGSTALLVRWQTISEKQRTLWADKLEKYGVEYSVAYWLKSNGSSRQVYRFSSYNASLHAILKDLLSSATYTVEVQSRLGASALECTWSNPASAESTTLKLPVLMPNCLRDAFSIDSHHPHEQQRNVTIFWKASPDAEVHPDGRVHSYFIAWEEGNATVSGVSRSATLTLHTERAYDVKLSARPSFSKLASTSSQACVHIPAQHSVLDLPRCRLSAESVNDSTVKVSWTWRAPPGKTFMYTVYWCAATVNDLCEGDLQSAPADSNWALVKLAPNSSALLYRFGVAASDVTDSSASGIVWAPCVNSNVTEPVLHPPDVVLDPSWHGNTAIQSTDALLIRYRYPCISGAPRLSDLRLHYCTGFSDACQDEAQVFTLDACKTEATISVDSHLSQLFWLSGRSGNVPFNSTSVMRAASLTVRGYYWMVPIAVGLTVAATTLAVALYKLQKSVNNVQTIAHIPRSSEGPEAECFLGASTNTLHAQNDHLSSSKIDGNNDYRPAHSHPPMSYMTKHPSSDSQPGGSRSFATAGSDTPVYRAAESVAASCSLYDACLKSSMVVVCSSSDSHGSDCQLLLHAAGVSPDGSLQYVATAASDDSLHYVAATVCQLHNNT